ncbi:MAG: UDP-N-acetylmuramoyl-L-alanine--D-glutamate ligase [Deltaproteobacteria bacterium CG_4_8_14_3_um_filter_45_9]|nr:MAG: UDP-N-acetylmuramoyl-L-alanine--D-glutamate ligase [Deltaproteobacteria bacterium CG03_land_8_20_14_0_80_45_14]PIX24639.1 MAG: UDP-N-acetylmuramoyl-L-alanine--D-glutamate ligase [Deltaproteobacteria bacterium CG_4_8_14_3_um_filter_45_9]
MDPKGKKVLVVGLARTGIATAKFLKAKGSLVTATEVKPKEEMGEAVQALKGMDISTEWGGHQTEAFLKQDIIVVSPGVDLSIEPIQKAVKYGVRVISEIELAYHFIHVPIIAVTGTNGKTTTTLLVGEMLKEDGRKVGVGGNVGEPLILFADGKDRWEVLVVEISSFQLEAIEDFRPRISVLLNITEDHLDRYPRYDDYIEAKVRIFANQNSGDLAVLNRDDPIIMQFREKVKAKKVLFSLKEKLGKGAFSNGQTISLRLGGEGEEYSLAKTPLKGIHNVENMMAALTTARIFGCSKKSIQDVLNRFKGLEHRLEFVREIGGVRFYNDSKGTNVGSVVKSLQSFSEPVTLIAGGKDKNGDLSPLEALIQKRVKHLILIGEAKDRMNRELGGLTDTVMAKTMEKAVLLAHQKAKAGEVVLLSPACSSFDMFKDYKERGKVFKETVKRL